MAQSVAKTPSQNGLGSPLADGFSVKEVLSLIDNKLLQDKVSVVGVVAWSRHLNQYLAFLCIPEKINPFDVGNLNTLRSSCSSDSDDNTSIYLALLEKKQGQPARLLAKGIFKQYQPKSVTLEDRYYWFKWQKFDLAPYKLDEQEEAFGVRVIWGTPYAGGGASTEVLYLFKVEGQTIKRVFAAFIGSQEDIAGDWHEDGTREHFQTDVVKILQILPSKTDGYYDFLIKDKDPQVKEKQVYKWSATKQFYLPVND